jgi:hypothetical protein
MQKKRRKLPIPYPPVCVEWIDSCEPMENAEVEASSFPEPQQIYQVGLLVKQTKDYITIAGAWKPECRTFDYVITIPTQVVKRIIRLK